MPSSKTARGAQQHDHSERVDCAHRQGMSHIASGQLDPDQYHGSAGGNTKQYRSGAVLFNFRRVKEPAENNAQE